MISEDRAGEVPEAMLKHTKELKKYLELTYEHTKSLKPKPGKEKR